jgi:hypothetical protein
MYQDPQNFASISKRQETGPSHFMTVSIFLALISCSCWYQKLIMPSHSPSSFPEQSYQAQTQGLTEQKKATGRKVVLPQQPYGSSSTSLGNVFQTPTAPRFEMCANVQD